MPSTTLRYGNETARDARRRERHKARRSRKPDEKTRLAEAQASAGFADGVMSTYRSGSARLDELVSRANEKRRLALEVAQGEVDAVLRPALREWHERRRSFNRFCAERGIEPVMELRQDRVRQTLIILVLLAIEWVGAGMLYGAHLAHPILGLAWAVMPVFFTFATAYGAALSARRIDRSNSRQMIESGVGMTVFGGFGLLGLLISAHLRDRFETAQLDAVESSLIEGVMAGPLDLSNAGWLLLLGSLAAFLFLVHHLHEGREKVPGLMAQTQALSAATQVVDREFRRIDQLMGDCINGTIEREAEKVERYRRDSSEAVEVVRGDLQRHGIVDPANPGDIDPDNEAIKLLLGKWRELRRLQDAIFGIGDLRVTLHHDDGNQSAAPVRREHLTECRRLDEARLWLDSQLAEWDFTPTANDTEDSNHA